MSPHIVRTALVTGSTSGIGREVAVRLHGDGFNVVITGRDQERGEKVLAELGQERAAFVAMDLTAPGAAVALADATIERFGRIDVVVNNAAQDHTGDLLDVAIEDIRRVFEVNTFAAIAMLQASAQRMEFGGSIINISSRLATIGVPTMGIYSAAKGAIKSLTTAAAVELADRDIRVNSVAPGMTRTPLYDAWVEQQDDPAETERHVVADIPLRRLATPADVAAVVSFLASEDAAYITGASIPVDGGYTAR